MTEVQEQTQVGPGPRAPTYYHWSMDKPATTNQTYGYLLREELAREAATRPHKVVGPFDYARPFSNAGFFPQITQDSSMSTGQQKSRPTRLSGTQQGHHTGRSVRTFDLNRGYTMGHVPISSRVVRRQGQVPVDVRQERSVSAPAAYRFPEARAKDMYLWHSLAGCLVHVKHHPARAGPAY